MRPLVSLLAPCLACSLASCGSVSDSADKPDAPTITTIDPAIGGIAGGVSIAVTGSNFRADGAGTPIVVVGGNQATDVAVTSDTQLTFTLPATDREGDIVDVTVSTDNGFVTKADAFTYNLRPIVLDVSPQVGRSVGGTMITIMGRGFESGTTPEITIGGGKATNVQIINDTTITAMTGAVMAGTLAFTPLDVEVTSSNGTTVLKMGFKVTTPGLLALEGGCCGLNRIFHVDLGTGRAVEIARADLKIHGCATSPSGQIFASTGRSQAPQQHRLVRLDPFTGTTVMIGPLTDAGAVNHGVSTLTFVGTNLYGIDTETGTGAPSNRIVQVSQTTGAVTVMGTTPMVVSRVSAIAVKDVATVFVADRASQSLDTATVANSTLTPGLAFVGGTGGPVKGLVNVGGTLYLMERNVPSTVYSITQGANAMLTKITDIPAQAVGLCETPNTF